LSEEGRRRRRRRGGRGRGRSRGREEGPFAEVPGGPSREPSIAGSLDEEGAPDEGELPAPARRAASAFGSVWDSQIGIPSARRATPSVEDEEDFDEPAVPEYLITERRQRDGGRGGARGGRGRGGAYAAALDRERFGGGRGSTRSGFQQPAPGGREPNFNRSDRPERMERGDRQPFRPAVRPAPRPSGDEPWSEVPPEIEAMLRAQLGPRAAAPRRESAPGLSAEVGTAPAEASAPAPTAGHRGRRPSAVEPEAVSAAGETAAEAPVKAPRTPARKRAAAATTTATEEAAEAAPAAKRSRATAKAPATTRTTTRKRATAKASESSADDAAAAVDAPATDAPKRRVTRRKADTAG
jgi:hypothetical protein